MRACLGLFIPEAGMMKHVQYQFAHPWLVDTQSFAIAFPDAGLPTRLEDALQDTALYFKQRLPAA